VFPTHKTNSHTPYYKPAQPENGCAIFGFGLTYAPSLLQGFDQKNTVIGKARGKASTANNKQFGVMAALTSFEKFY